jgi:hypothetical protein
LGLSILGISKQQFVSWLLRMWCANHRTVMFALKQKGLSAIFADL